METAMKREQKNRSDKRNSDILYTIFLVLFSVAIMAACVMIFGKNNPKRPSRNIKKHTCCDCVSNSRSWDDERYRAGVSDL